MSMTFSERFSQICKERDLTQLEISNKIGVSRQAVARWLNGSAEPDKEKILALSDFLNLPPGFLMFGEEGAFDSVEVDEDTISIPVLDIKGSCGPKGHINTPWTEMVKMIRVAKAWILARTKAPNFKCLHIITADGDSMDPTISDGDFVIVDTSKNHINSDGIFIIQSGDDTFIKRVQRNINGSLLLISDNPKYHPFEVGPENRDSMRVIGRCLIACKANEL